MLFSNKILSNSTRSLLPEKKTGAHRRPSPEHVLLFPFFFVFVSSPNVVYVFCTRGQTRFIYDSPPVIAGNQCRTGGSNGSRKAYVNFYEDNSTSSSVTDIFQKSIINIWCLNKTRPEFSSKCQNCAQYLESNTQMSTIYVRVIIIMSYNVQLSSCSSIKRT